MCWCNSLVKKYCCGASDCRPNLDARVVVYPSNWSLSLGGRTLHLSSAQVEEIERKMAEEAVKVIVRDAGT